MVYYSTNDHDTMFSTDGFDHMVETAKSVMNKYKATNHSQVIVVITAKGNMYHTLVADATVNKFIKVGIEESALLDILKANHEEEIKSIICMWPDESIEMPSYVLRKKICAMHPNNKNAEMILSGENCFIKKTIAETFSRAERETL